MVGTPLALDVIRILGTCGSLLSRENRILRPKSEFSSKNREAGVAHLRRPRRCAIRAWRRNTLLLWKSIMLRIVLRIA